MGDGASTDEGDRPGRVAERYEDLLRLFELQWKKGTHQSIHFGYYDEEHDDPDAAVTNTTRQLAAEIGVESGDRVLDVGCGAGGDAVWLARAYDATVIGMDLAGDLLVEGVERAEAGGVEDRVSFRVGDFHDLGAVDGTVDVVWAMESLSHATDVAAVFSGARSVLEPGGRIGVADVFLQDDVTEAGRERVRELGADMGIDLRPIREVATALDEAGFASVEARDVTPAIRPGAEASDGSAGMGGSLARVGSALGLDAEAYAEYFAFRERLHELLARDVAGYYFVTATAAE